MRLLPRKYLNLGLTAAEAPMHPQERGEVIKLYNRASPHWIIVFINGAVAVRHRCDIAQGMVLLDLQHVDRGDAAQTVQ
jgi:hypothetical protein